jgi:hypothetical protein
LHSERLEHCFFQNATLITATDSLTHPVRLCPAITLVVFFFAST